MSFIILKHNPNNPHVVIVNDSEGIPMEWDTFESAQNMADIFQANSSHNCTYEVKEWRTPSI
jgi:hypothetical protein